MVPCQLIDIYKKKVVVHSSHVWAQMRVPHVWKGGQHLGRMHKHSWIRAHGTTRKQWPNRQNMSETRCPNLQKIDKKNWQTFVTLDKLLSIRTFCVNFLSFWINFYQFFCSLGCLDSDMFLSIRPLFPCSVGTFKKLLNSLLQLNIGTAADKLQCRASAGLHYVGDW